MTMNIQVTPAHTCVKIPTTLSLNPDLYQYNEDASIVSVVAYCIDVRLSHPTQFGPLLQQNSEKNAKDPATIPEP